MVVKTVVEAQDIFDKAWEGFKGKIGAKKLAYLVLYKQTTLLMTEMKVS